MRKQTENNIPVENRISVDITGLQQLLSCGAVSANKIAAEAGAVIYVGKRKLFNVRKIQNYLDKISAGY